VSPPPSAAIYLCVSIDCECDKGPGWKLQRPLRFGGITEGIEARLEPLFRAHGAKATYLLSPEVMRDDASLEALRRVAATAELGTHLHGEFATPDDFEPEVTRVFQRDYPREVEQAKLASLTADFTRAFDHPPRSFRAGRFGIGDESLGMLADLGYLVESSVTPFVEHSDVGAPGLDFRGAPTQPYHPDPRLPGVPGDSPLLEVPVTIRPRLMNRLPLLGKRLERRWLRPTRGSGRALVDLAKDEIDDARATAPGRPVVLNAMFHNVEVVPGASPYAQNEREAAGILGRLAALLEFARGSRIAVVGLGDLPEIFAAVPARS
jgi:hypothetical protein